MTDARGEPRAGRAAGVASGTHAGLAGAAAT